MVEWYVGFHRPYFTKNGRIDPRGWFGHCEIWGYTTDDTWLFIDPMGAGSIVRVMHRHDDVQDQLHARFALCALILRLPARDPAFRLPLHGMLTCASVCGHLLGVRALVPATLRRKLLANGAEVIHETERRPQGQSGAAA
jgi:hypothetical protein